MPTDLEILNEAVRLLEKRSKLALCTVIEKKGSGPRSVGSKMIVTEDGKNYGTIGGGILERSLIDESVKTIKEGKSRKITFNLTKNSKEGLVQTGMICGGELTILVDVMEPILRLIIVGTGHIAAPLAKLANIVGFKVVIIGDENSPVNKDQFPMAEDIIAGDFSQVLSKFELTSSDFVVIAHGDPEHDYAALKTMIAKNPTYVGLLGSRTKAALLIQRLKKEGINEAQLKTLHAPLGLDIGAETPEEIGISILAQIIQCKRQQ